MAKEIVFKPSRNDLDVLRAGGIGFGRIVWGLILCALGGGLLWGISSQGGDFPDAARRAAGVAGWILIALGGLCLLWRRSFLIDRRQATYSACSGLLLPCFKRVRSLKETKGVELAKVVRRGGETSVTVYPVGIRTVERLIALSEFKDYQAARTQAETIAKFLDTGMTDTSSGQAVVREAGCLDESLRAKAARTMEQVDLPEPPADCAIECRQEGPDVHLAWAAFPPRRLRIWFWRSLALGGLGTLWGLPIALQALDSNGSFPWGMYAVVISLSFLPFLTYGTWSARLARLRVNLFISSGSLRLERFSLREQQVEEIPMERLEELEKVERRLFKGVRVSPVQRQFLSLALGGAEKRYIMARSDDTTLTFGHYLEREDLDWLYGTLRFLVAAPVDEA